jgi:hypothetical protein
MSPQSIWGGLAEEFSFHNAYLGNNWALRPRGDEGALMKDGLQEQWQEFEAALHYFQKLEGELASPQRQQSGEVALYVDTRSLSLCPSADAHVLQAFMALLLLKRVPFKIIFQGQPIPEEAHTILICGQRSLDAVEVDRLAVQSERKCQEVWLLGDAGAFNQWLVLRGGANRKKLLQRANFRSFPMPLIQWVERGPASKKYFSGKTPSFTQEGQAALEPLLERLAGRQQINISAPDGILANIELAAGDRLLIHLRDLREGHTKVNHEEVRVRLEGTVPEVLGYSPAWPGPTQLSVVQKNGDTLISLPEFRHYACLVFSRPSQPQRSSFDD